MLLSKHRTFREFASLVNSVVLQSSVLVDWLHSLTDVVDHRPSESLEIRFNHDHSITEGVLVQRLVIATGHSFVEPDEAELGYYSSPWSMQKLIPEESHFHNFEIGTLGTSLSAFDVISSLSHRQGKFI